MILEDIPDDTRTCTIYQLSLQLNVISGSKLSRPRPNVRAWAVGRLIVDLQLSRDLCCTEQLFPRECSMFVEEVILNLKPVFLCLKIDNCSVYW